MVNDFVNRIRMLVWALLALPLAAFCTVLFVLAVAGFPLVVVWVGIPLLFATILTLRPIANIHRRYAGALIGREVGSPYLRRPSGNLLVRMRGLLIEPATWRDFAWVAVNGTVGLVLCIVGIVEGILDLIFWWLPPGMMVRVHAYLACALLAPNERTSLAQRVQQLTESRAETVDTSAAELRRIERDLHDGAQARLVALGMSLGLAEEQLARDPDNARALLAEARETSSAALAELRDLVRGIHPPVLADRGLVGAVRALCLASPIPVEVTDELSGRLPAPVESAAYFALAEAVTNMIKHSGASTASVHIEHREGLLRMQVRDDGAGGADESLGTGLRGIARRLSAFDGTLDVTSPVGGPTVLTMTLPCTS
ncbi:MAG TPA: sensor domain-containing protein [Jatrophihabitantaceae bacterium]|nr:sensor domain-containing protein [Jatrophihabitantaceae bacterium]